jgi:hypothetical protein
MDIKNEFIEYSKINIDDDGNLKFVVNGVIELLKLTNNKLMFLKNKTQTNKYNLLENFVYEISKKYLTCINREKAEGKVYCNLNEKTCKIDIEDNIKISFKQLNSYNRMNLEFDLSPIKPVFSCMVYLNETSNNNTYSFFTNIDTSSYKYKSFYESNNVFNCVSPKLLNLITFDVSKYYHNHISENNDMNILLINFWENKNNIEMNIYNSNDELVEKNKNNIYPKLTINKINNVLTINSKNHIFDNRMFYDSIFYKNDIISYFFLKTITNAYSYDSINVEFSGKVDYTDNIESKTNKLKSIKFLIPS